jgi:hypothetical protein
MARDKYYESGQGKARGKEDYYETGHSWSAKCGKEYIV